MSVNPDNPALPPASAPAESESLLQWRIRSAAAIQKQADATAQMAATAAGEETSEAAIYLRILIACIHGRVATTSDDLQVWASDLTKDYLKKYPLKVVPPAL